MKKELWLPPGIESLQKGDEYQHHHKVGEGGEIQFYDKDNI